jgi:acyl-ACP thioesterase
VTEKHPTVGRMFRGHGVVRLGDAAVDGRVRLDAMARYLQDVAEDDVADAGWKTSVGFVLRRCALVVHRFPQRGEQLTLQTFCSAISPRWAERSTVIEGTDGGSVEARALWVAIDMTTGRPARLDESFSQICAPSAAGRRASARLTLEGPEANDIKRRPWPLRAVDIDAWGHVNNAVHWEAVEDELTAVVPGPLRAVIEYREPIVLSDSVELQCRRDEKVVDLWLGSDERLLAAARVEW